MNDLLDKFTQLLAYAGDNGAKDGYFLRSNNSGNPVYSIPIRSESLSGVELKNLANQIKNLLESGKPLVNIPTDITKKANSLKEEYNVSDKETKEELIEYIDTYEANPMQGGMRQRNKRKSRKLKKSRKSSKARKSRR